MSVYRHYDMGLVADFMADNNGTVNGEYCKMDNSYPPTMAKIQRPDRAMEEQEMFEEERFTSNIPTKEDVRMILQTGRYFIDPEAPISKERMSELLQAANDFVLHQKPVTIAIQPGIETRTFEDECSRVRYKDIWDRAEPYRIAGEWDGDTESYWLKGDDQKFNSMEFFCDGFFSEIDDQCPYQFPGKSRDEWLNGRDARRIAREEEGFLAKRTAACPYKEGTLNCIHWNAGRGKTAEHWNIPRINRYSQEGFLADPAAVCPYSGSGPDAVHWTIGREARLKLHDPTGPVSLNDFK